MSSSPASDPVAAGRSWMSSQRRSGAVGYAPARVNLIGEHLDYNGGPSLPIAIPYWTHVAAQPVETPGLVIESEGYAPYADREPVSAARARNGDWTDYLVGTLMALREHMELPVGLQLRVRSTVPPGAGLSSSASLTIAAAMALLRMGGLPELSRDLVALVSRSAENEFVGTPTGDLDQCAILGARPDFAVLCRPGEGPRRHVRWTPEDRSFSLVVVATGVRHELSDGGYARRVTECRSAAEHLGVGLLSDPRLDRSAAESLTDETERRRARHVLSELRRVEEAVASLDREDVAAVGPLLTESHTSLRDDFEVSCPELDLVVERACSSGALGARMTGGGFGGSAIALCPTERVDAVRSSIRRAFAEEGLRPPAFLEGRAVGRAGSFTA